MMNVLYEAFPENITADGKSYPIRTDFRQWLQFSDIKTNPEISDSEKILFLLRLIKLPPLQNVTENLVKALFAFWRADALNSQPEHDEEPETPPIKPPVLDWKIDSAYVLGDFRHYYQMDLRKIDFLHWWEFLTLFSALPEESICIKRIACRSADLSQIPNDAERKRVRKIQRAIALPFEMSDEAIGEIMSGMM